MAVKFIYQQFRNTGKITSPMISRKSTKILADLYQHVFSVQVTNAYQTYKPVPVNINKLYDFLYERDFSGEFLRTVEQAVRAQQRLSDFIKRIHTGESINQMATGISVEQVKNLQSELLQNLAAAIIEEMRSRVMPERPKLDGSGIKPGRTHAIMAVADLLEVPFHLSDRLEAQLQLDGYIYRDGRLYPSESSLIPFEEEQNLLQLLIKQLPIGNKVVILHHLENSESHYLEGKWSDSISNARNFFEETLKQTALYLATKENAPLSEEARAVDVRKFLEETVKFLDKREREAIQYVYGLISERGSHPSISEQDEARLMRHLALSLSQFVLLKLEKIG